MRGSPRLLAVAAIAAAVAASGSGAANAGGSPIDGRWTWTWPAAQLRHAGAGSYDVKTMAGPGSVVFAHGRYLARFANSGRVASGRFSVEGDVIRLAPDKRDPHDVPGKIVFMRFSIFRDRLTWSVIPGRSGWTYSLISPLTRIT
jgi:hypothetical protein